MTQGADFKRLARDRMASTGEPYTAARAALLRQKEVPMSLVPCDARVHFRTDEELKVAQDQAAKEGRALTEQDLEILKLPPVILTERGGERQMWFLCRDPEATAIQWALDGLQLERPMTHDMLRNVVAAMGNAKEARITHLEGTTFFAELVVIDTAGVEHVVSCRPSDSVAFAVRAEIPILVADELLVIPHVGESSADSST